MPGGILWGEALAEEGVWTTADCGLTWAAMNAGLEGQVVHRVALGASGGVLCAGTGGYVFGGPGGHGVFQIRLP